jgi:hypothetical protein
MDTVTSIILYALLGLVAFLVIGFIGLKIPAPLSWPIDEPVSELEQQAVPDSLPPTVRRWLSADGGALPAPASSVAWGRGSISSRLPLLGRVWLPLSWTLYLLPGSSFIMQTRITWFRRRFIRGGEEYREGKGTYILGTEVLDKPYLDETERALGWLFYLWLCPGSLFNSPGVQVQEQGGTAVVTVNQPEKPALTFKLSFDPDSGALKTIATSRKGSVSGVDYPYIASFSQPRTFDSTASLPTRYFGEWDGDGYLKLELAGVKFNQDLTEVMQTGIVDLN